MKRRPSSPGEILLKEFIEPIGLKKLKVAKELGMSTMRLNTILSGKGCLKLKEVLSLAEFTKMTRSFWIILQMNYIAWEIRK